eukprot:GHVL01005919.1.p1 GENE.GHVL01005919.1~~GHVL01005919.1.p1  ORF type:complete len:245 (-),score=82.63 GHVL01005919.1:52-786(-)
MALDMIGNWAAAFMMEQQSVSEVHKLHRKLAAKHFYSCNVSPDRSQRFFIASAHESPAYDQWEPEESGGSRTTLSSKQIENLRLSASTLERIDASPDEISKCRKFCEENVPKLVSTVQIADEKSLPELLELKDLLDRVLQSPSSQIDPSFDVKNRDIDKYNVNEDIYENDNNIYENIYKNNENIYINNDINLSNEDLNDPSMESEEDVTQLSSTSSNLPMSVVPPLPPPPKNANSIFVEKKDFM